MSRFSEFTTEELEHLEMSIEEADCGWIERNGEIDADKVTEDLLNEIEEELERRDEQV